MDRSGERDGLARRMGALLAGEARAMAERIKLERARAIIWAQSHRRAPPWPSREESDRKFLAAWEAFERGAAGPQRGWEPDLSDPCAPDASHAIGELRSDTSGAPCETPAGRVTEADRDMLLAWLGTGSPMARRVMAWLLGLDAASASELLGGGQ